jgi:hypothetical protein
MKRALYGAILSVAIIMLTVSSGLAEIDGLRGLKWATDFQTVESQMEYVRTDPSFGGVKFYRS